MTQEGSVVSVVIPVLDAGPMLFDSLASVDPADERVEVILVDNGSSDGMVAKAREQHPRIRVVRNETNLGFAVAADQGMTMAATPYVLFLNADAVLQPGGLWTLLDVARSDASAAIWQPIIVDAGGCVENAGEYFTWTGFFIRRREVPDGVTPYAVFAGTAACMLARRDVLTYLGGFTEGFFAYIEDVDLCWRARSAGWEVRVVPSVRAKHVRSVTTRRILEPHEIRFLTFRNRLRTILANGSGPERARILPGFVSACLGTALVLALSGRLRSAAAIIRALSWPLSHRREMRVERERARSTRVTGSRTVLRPELMARSMSREGLRMLADHYRRWEG